jgi:hypothetical protein
MLLAWIRHLARFEPDEHRTTQLGLALLEWDTHASASSWTRTGNAEPAAKGWCGVEASESDGSPSGGRKTPAERQEVWGDEGSGELPIRMLR